MRTGAPNVLSPATNMSIQRWYNKTTCGWCGSHYSTNELSPWQSDLSANEARRPCAGGSTALGQPGEGFATGGRRAALNTRKSSLKCHFWPICLSVSRRPISHTVTISAEWLQFITVSHMMTLAGVYWEAIQTKTNGHSNIAPRSYSSSRFTYSLIPSHHRDPHMH